MPVEQPSCGWQVSWERRPAQPGPQCPVCGGTLVPLRGFWRCTRCAYLLCVGCEAGHATGSADSDD